MAAYAALVSLEHIVNNLHLHPRPPISLHKEQFHLITEKVAFLQEFLEVYNPNLAYSTKADPLESRIARAAYAAEDAIESHIVDQFTNDGEKMSSDGLYQALDKAIEDMTLIEKEAMEINKEAGGFRNQLHSKPTTPADSSTSSTSSISQKKSMMVGADDLFLEMKSRLTDGARDLKTLPIVGMGGSGKTTLALNIYQDRLIEEHFDIRAWVTISQEYSIREILTQVLSQLIKGLNQDSSEGELELMVHKHLYGRKYMVILDDMWSVEAWDGVKRSLPDSNNGSRIVITTRLTSLASALPNSNSLGMKLLDEDACWDLLSKTVFGEKDCPPGFDEIGKKIGKSCKGLPLSIVVVGGLLAKSEQTREFWEHVEGNLNAIVNLDDDERCLKTLYMSYKQLPVHLKPCFLYMGIYCEDHKIRISNLIKLWVAEGFLKPVSGKRLEDAARAYLKDLIDRNLILIHKLGSIGSIKKCKVHDLLRDLCLREAQKEGFYTVCPGHEIRYDVSRTVISGSMPQIEEIDALSPQIEEIDALSPQIEEIDALSSTPLARSLILNLKGHDVPPHIFRLLRIVDSSTAPGKKIRDNMHQLVNLRLFNFKILKDFEFPSLICLFWNLQILYVGHINYEEIAVPTDIWYMSHIRHLYIYRSFYLPDDPPSVQDGLVLANLQTLGKIKDFTCSEQVVKRMPNIRKLRLYYDEGVDDRFNLTNLDRMDKLESLICLFRQSMCLINYPQSLKKLTLVVPSSQCWQDILDKVGALPLLQKLQLSFGTFKEGQWETTEGQFRSLKFLSLSDCGGLRVWTSEASHFPRLEQLHLDNVSILEEIPTDFAEIPMLRLIDMDDCSDSAIESAKRILEEQEALYGEEETTLQIQVKLWREFNHLAPESLRHPNFRVTII